MVFHMRLSIKALLNVASSSYLAVTSHDLMTSCLNSPKKLDLMLALRNSVFGGSSSITLINVKATLEKVFYANLSLLLIFLAAELCDLLRTRAHNNLTRVAVPSQ